MAQTSTPQDEIAVLKALVQRIGAASEAEVWELLEGQDRAVLTAEGALISTSRVTHDCARDYQRALDFMDKATDEQKEALMAVSMHDLRVAIWAALQVAVLGQQREVLNAPSITSRPTGSKAQISELKDKCTARRTQMYTMFGNIIGSDETLRAELERAHGSAADERALLASLQALAHFGRKLLDSQEPALVNRRSRTVLSDPLLDKTEAMAEELRAALEPVAAPQPAAQITEEQVDLWEGVNLVLYERIVNAFTAARQSDATIPQLEPVATFRYYHRKRRR